MHCLDSLAFFTSSVDKIKMKVLIIGSGGREHAMAWKAAQSHRVETVYVAPGNGGTALEPKIENVAINATDTPALLTFASDHNIDLTIVGPEAPLVAGVVDAFQDKGLRCFGPCKAAAQLEGSKVYTKDFLKRHRIPTADYCAFTETQPAIDYVKALGAPLVVKADGLAAGKGVVIAHNEEDAISAINDMLGQHTFGDAGKRIVIEEFMAGEEASFIIITDGEHILPFASSQDHKARDNGDQGPNTGGMGAYSPAPVVTAELHERIMTEVIKPTVRGMAADGNRYVGFLYAGVMITADGTPKVLEFNCRFGDPETQPIMLRLKSDLVSLCNAALDQQLDQHHIEFDERAALGVVLAAGGYPGSYTKGNIIHGLPENDSIDCKVFHAGTIIKENQVTTNGGRVLCATALGNTVSEAQQRAYELAHTIHWDNIYYRNDIGHKAVARECN